MATSAQTEHQQRAGKNREQLASVNHGRPAIAATAKPAEFSGRGVVAARRAGAPYKASETKAVASHTNENKSAGTHAAATHANDNKATGSREASTHSNASKPAATHAAATRANDNKATGSRSFNSLECDKPAATHAAAARTNDNKANENRGVTTRRNDSKAPSTPQPQPARTKTGRRKINQPQLAPTSQPRIGQLRIMPLSLRRLVRTVPPPGRPHRLFAACFPSSDDGARATCDASAECPRPSRPHPIRRVRRERSLQLVRRTRLALRKKRPKLKSALGTQPSLASRQSVLLGSFNLVYGGAGPKVPGPAPFFCHHATSEGRFCRFADVRSAVSPMAFIVRVVRCLSQLRHRKA